LSRPLSIACSIFYGINGIIISIENSATKNKIWEGKAIFSISALSTTSKIILFLLLCISTAFSVVLVDKYQNVGRQLLLNADFSKELEFWQPPESSSGKIVAYNNQLILRSHDAGKSVQVSQNIQSDLNGKKFRLRATLASRNVVPGEKKWNKARLLLVQYIDGKAQWKFSHVLAALDGTHGWQIYNKAFRLSPECSELRVIAQMSRCRGELFVKGLSLYEVEESATYTWVKWLIRAAWILFIFVLLVPGLKGGGSTLLKIFIVLTVAGIVVGTTLPGQVKNELKEDITKEVHTYTAPVKKITEGRMDTAQYKFFMLDITKIAHFCLFSLLALLLLLKNPCRPMRLILLELFMLACATEFMQFYIDGRSPLITDVLIDMAGGAVGMMAGRCLASVCPGGCN